MPKHVRTLAEVFSNKINNIENVRTKVEDLLVRGEISHQDIVHFYGGLFLEIFTEFELLLENVFVGLLSGQISSAECPTSTHRFHKITPANESRKVLFGTKSYLDWLPYKNNTLRLAKVYFLDGGVFNHLNNSEMKALENFHYIRNAIAHKSESALNKFENILQGLTLLPRERLPTGYLRSIPSPITNQTQFEIISIELVRLARKICR